MYFIFQSLPNTELQIACNKIMTEPHSQSFHEEDDEDEAISQIKVLASEIFTSFSDNSHSLYHQDEELNNLDFEKGLFHSRATQDRKYSLTQRCLRHQQFDTTPERMPEQLQNNDAVQNELPQQKAQGRDTEKSQGLVSKQSGKNPKQKPAQNFKKKIGEKNIAKGKQKESNIPIEKKCEHSNPPPLLSSSSRLLKKTGNLKESTANELQNKKMEEARQYRELLKKTKKNKTLEEIYQEKEPLYDRWIKSNQTKQFKIEESRISALDKEMQGFLGEPAINKNVQVKGSFQQRINQETKKRQKNFEKIMYQTMKNTTFTPKTNSPKRYQNISSKVKNIWSGEKPMQEQTNDLYSTGDGNDLKGISHSLLKTGSFFSQESIKNRSFELKLKTMNELTNILEIDDLFEE